MGCRYYVPKHTEAEFGELAGKTLDSVVVSPANDEIRFVPAEGPAIVLHHCQDCCESVEVEDVCGDLGDLVGSPVLLAEEVSSEQGESKPAGLRDDSYTWTFYKVSTAKGSVTIRWLGTSNGYYSESVHCCREERETP